MKFLWIAAWMGIFFPGIGERVCAQTIDAARSRILADSFNRMARGYYGKDADSAFYCGNRALEYADRTGYRKGEAEAWRMLGNTHEMLGDYVNMLGCYQHSLDIARQIGNTELAAKVDVNLALFYKQQGEYDQAQQLMEKVAELCKKTGDTLQAAYVASHLADLALRQQRYDEALQYAGQALRTVREVGDSATAASYNNDFGAILAAKRDFRGAVTHYLESLAYYQGVRDRLGTTATYNLLAQAYLGLKDYPRALGYAETSLKEAGVMRRKLEQQGSAKVLADIYTAKGDYRDALHYYKLYKDFSDSLFNDQSHKQILTRAAQYDYDQKASRLREAQAIKDAGYERKLSKAALQISITVSVIAVLSLLAFLLLRGRAVNRRMNRLLREKNRKIEEQKETLEQQAVQLLLSNQQKDKLFGVVAHDLRGPMNSLQEVLTFLKEKRFSEQELSGMVGELRRNVDATSEMVGNLLSWAGRQLKGPVVNAVVVPVAELAEEMVGLYNQQAREKQVLLTTVLPEHLLGYADKDMVQVVLRNVVSNAIKFSRPGDQVTITGVKKGAEIEISVTDTGIGMTTDALERIRRRESFTTYGTAKEKGTGLGILLCHEFAEANRGRFYAESEWGKGSRCYFTIPAAPSSSSISV
jgi:signal transduction histidine kinase